MNKSKEEWRAELSDEQYRVTAEAGTEAPFSGEYCNHFDKGTYHCVCCDHALFDSGSKFHSGCGCRVFMVNSNKRALNRSSTRVSECAAPNWSVLTATRPGPYISRRTTAHRYALLHQFSIA